MSDWTQAICIKDWVAQNPDRTPVRMRDEYAEPEMCAWCGATTEDGIYVRVDPATVPYPTRES